MRTWMSQLARPLAVALVCLGASVPTLAQEAPPAVAPAANEEPATPLSPEDSALIANALGQGLLFDAEKLSPERTVTLRTRRKPQQPQLDVSRTDRPDGSSTVAIKKPLPTEWNTKIGADLGLAADQSGIYSPNNPLRVTRASGGTGAAWASVGVPDIATVDARVDPANDTGRLATTFTRAIPVGRTFGVTLKSSYSVTESFGQPQPAPSEVPLMAAPASEPGAPVPQVWGQQNVAKLDILPSGTTLAAGLSTTSTDPVTHNTLSAEQKVYGPLRVTTAMTDVGLPGESKSISARFKLNW